MINLISILIIAKNHNSFILLLKKSILINEEPKFKFIVLR